MRGRPAVCLTFDVEERFPILKVLEHEQHETAFAESAAGTSDECLCMCAS